jgi:chorismate lyase/3-hydroxybenzoate synthase
VSFGIASLADAWLAIELGAATFHPRLPLLAGEPVENLFGAAESVGTAGEFRLFRSNSWLLGAASVSATPAEIEVHARRLYAELLRACAAHHLVRIWNYVPDINGTGPGELENYRAFCRGRSLAFEDQLGAEFKVHLPSASAVGCHDGRLTIAFAASAEQPRHFENPLQVPAYDYPTQYGPRPPSFARATVVPRAGREPAVFISGTAAIRGHATMAPESTAAQLDCTIQNLRAIAGVCGLGHDFAAGRRARHFKVYLRHAEDLAEVARTLEQQLFHATDRISYVQADICRASLRVEIEATLL